MSVEHIARIDANLLVALDALLLEGTVTRAAQRLGVSQSAMSHKLRRLRGLLDDELLIPSPRGMLPTARASKLAPFLRSAVDSMQQALRPEPEFDPQRSTRTHRVITSDYAELVIMPQLVARLSALAPNIGTVLLPRTDACVAQLTDGTADVTIGGPLQGPGLRRRVLYYERLLCAVRADHPQVGETLDLETWLSLGHIVYSGSGSSSPIDTMLHKRGLARRVVVRTPRMVGGPLIVARTDFVYTGLSAPLRELAGKLSLRLFPVPLPLPTTTFETVMTWHERYDQEPGAKWLRNFCAEATIDAVAQHGLRAASKRP